MDRRDRILAVLRRRKAGATTRDIAKATRLRYESVRLGLLLLEASGRVHREFVRSGGRGRPVHVWRAG